ncbi:hypothetical protein T01_9484 [Trichinella spiralis]|uniref:Uncharacterized protein n=1 Tax=Trichinella spiralis TaxID=6334 RepID=A0A0V1AR19_TRISP|nr:hypothetical protein T01_1735 [Trichinella spiralis]KRY27784.1 hypothetical protein T01_9484 [Trichinella spiralis]
MSVVSIYVIIQTNRPKTQQVMGPDYIFQDDKLESASNRRRWKRQIQLVLRHRAALEVAIRKNIAPSASPAGSYAAS